MDKVKEAIDKYKRGDIDKFILEPQTHFSRTTIYGIILVVVLIILASVAYFTTSKDDSYVVLPAAKPSIDMTTNLEVSDRVESYNGGGSYKKALGLTRPNIKPADAVLEDKKVFSM